MRCPGQLKRPNAQFASVSLLLLFSSCCKRITLQEMHKTNAQWGLLTAHKRHLEGVGSLHKKLTSILTHTGTSGGTHG
jgi:hypothetical protein